MNHLAFPQALALLALLPIAAWALARRRRASGISFSAAPRAAALPRSWRVRVRWLPSAMRLASLALLIVAIARPQETSGQRKTSTEGVALQIVMDRSGSMREPIEYEGAEATKLEVVQRVLAAFVLGDGKALKGRPGDMIGLIAFARFADTISPLARVHQPLAEAVKQVQTASTRAEDGTAIGDALSLAAARLRRAEEEVARSRAAAGDSKAKPDFTIKSKAIVLLTDGQNNAGEASVEEAATLCKQWGIRIYAIGVGAGERFAVMRGLFGDQRVPVGSGIDERTLTASAEATGGKYWPAEDGESLRQAYAEIDALEKTRIDVQEFTSYHERFVPLAAAALGLLLFEAFVSATFLRRSP
ncbi:MAG: vWA domain-containing protein [Phycisphaerales bacterium]